MAKKPNPCLVMPLDGRTVTVPLRDLGRHRGKVSRAFLRALAKRYARQKNKERHARRRPQVQTRRPRTRHGISRPRSTSPPGDDDDEGPRELRLPLSALDPHPLSEQLYGHELAPGFLESIAENGVIQALEVVKRGGRYRLLSGHRRFWAARQADLPFVPVRVVDIPEEDEPLYIIEHNHRHEKTASQRLREAEVLEPIMREQAHQRMLSGRGADGSGGRARTRKADSPQERRTRDALAHRVGLGSGVQLERLRKIAERRPALLAEIDAGKKSIGGAWAELRREARLQQQDEAISTIKPRADVLLGDCREVLSTLQDGRFAAVISDPPYGVSTEGREVDRIDTISINSDFGQWDHLSEQEAHQLIEICAREFFRLLRAGGALYLFPGDRLIDAWMSALRRVGFTFPRPCTLVWVKSNPPPSIRKAGWRSAIEHILYALKPGPDTINYLGDAEMVNALHFPIVSPGKRTHPTEKPTQLLERLIRVSTNPGDEILDPFAGSGSTGEAAIRTGRHVLLIEKDQRFHAMATRRIHETHVPVNREGGSDMRIHEAPLPVNPELAPKGLIHEAPPHVNREGEAEGAHP